MGDTVRVRYLKEDPFQARIDTFIQLWFFPLIFGGLGFLFGMVGSVLMLTVLWSARKEKWLLENGQIVMADIQEIVIDRSIRLNGRHPYRILCQWHDSKDNTVFSFKSKAIWFNPEKFIHQKAIAVRIDPNDPRRHLVDTHFLPKSKN